MNANVKIFFKSSMKERSPDCILYIPPTVVVQIIGFKFSVIVVFILFECSLLLCLKTKHKIIVFFCVYIFLFNIKHVLFVSVNFYLCFSFIFFTLLFTMDIHILNLQIHIHLHLQLNKVFGGMQTDFDLECVSIHCICIRFISHDVCLRKM